ncbi:PKD domain-containing protein [Candidatus Bipolaricaulota bacterium]|nr:PKD domain-containing protein [Candidatus Bipolaricaulota bacterium]
MGKRGRAGSLMLAAWILALMAALSGCTWWGDPPVVALRGCFAGELGLLTVRFFAYVTPTSRWDGTIAEIVAYEWDFGDGSSTTTPFGWDVVHEYEEAGDVDVRVTVIDSRGKRGIATLAMEVYEPVFVREWSLTLGFPVRVSGVAESRHDEVLDEVVVRAKFYDTAGIRFTQGEAIILGLEPGEQAYFEVKAEEYSPWIFYADVGIAQFSTTCVLDPFESETRADAACQ